MMSMDQRLDYAERWLRDGLLVLRPPSSVHQVTVDMTNALAALERLRLAGVMATATPLVVHAAARALAMNADLHQIVAGNRRNRPARVDIGLSVSGQTFVAPVLVIEAADQKSIEQLAAEIVRRIPDVQAADMKMLQLLRRWGRLVPFGLLRRAILRVLFRSAEFRRRGTGTFQVSTVPTDWASSSVFGASGVLIAGRIASEVVVRDDRPAVRPVMRLTLSCDHGVWDGRSAARFLAGVKAILESSGN